MLLTLYQSIDIDITEPLSYPLPIVGPCRRTVVLRRKELTYWPPWVTSGNHKPLHP